MKELGLRRGKVEKESLPLFLLAQTRGTDLEDPCGTRDDLLNERSPQRDTLMT